MLVFIILNVDILLIKRTNLLTMFTNFTKKELMILSHFINTKDILIPSEEHKISMYPMDFEEFL